MNTTQAYSKEHHPPAAVFDIYLSVPDTYNWHGPFPALLDSGADVTIIPMSLIATLRVPAIDEIVLISQWHDRHVMRLFQVDIQIAGLLFPAVDVVSDRWSKEVLLGRNVLNRLDLRLEGPKLRTHVLRK
jgi:hypothetical protein